MKILFAHGLEGKPNGHKARAMREAGLTVVAPDGTGLPLAARIAGLEDALSEPMILVGSSYGGLAALVVATRHPARVAGLVLAAPAVILREPPVDDPDALVIPASVPASVIHAPADAVIPFSASEALIRRSPHARLFAPDDDHLLQASMDLLISEVRRHLDAAARRA